MKTSKKTTVAQSGPQALEAIDARELDGVVGGFQLNTLNTPIFNLLGQVGVSGIGGIGQNFGVAQINNFN